MLANIRDYFHEKLTRLLYDHNILQYNYKDPDQTLEGLKGSDKAAAHPSQYLILQTSTACPSVQL
jgi:hypothetical protein